MESGDSLTRVLFYQHVKVGPMWRDFPLQVKGIQFTFQWAFSALVKFDPDTTVSAVLGLKSEEVLASAPVDLAKAMLQ